MLAMPSNQMNSQGKPGHAEPIAPVVVHQASLPLPVQAMSSCVHAVLLLAALALPLAAAQPSRWLRPTLFCDIGSGGKYSAGSAYEDNLMSLMRGLRDNSSSSPALFAAGAVGADPDTVYGVVFCQGDVSFSDCYDCGKRALQDVGSACNRSRNMALCYNECYIRLSDTDFLASTTTSTTLIVSRNNITSRDVAGYAGAVTDLLGATARYAAEKSTRRFATGAWTGTDPGFPNIYSTAQCTPDLSSALCLSCLQDLVDKWRASFNRSSNTRIVGTRCILRSEMTSTAFYTGVAMVRLPIQAAALAPGPAAAPGGTTGGHNINAIWIVAGTILSVPVVWFVLSWFMWKRAGIIFVKRAGLEEFRRFHYSYLFKATGGFSLKNTLGEGNFGIVYRGIFKKRGGLQEEVAVKRIKESALREANTVLGELTATSQISHKNVVKLKGWCCRRIKWKLSDFMLCRQQHDTDLFLVYELMPNGSLHDHLFRDTPEQTVLSWKIRYKIAKGIASGLCYLHHQCKPFILHRDIKPANILLDADFNPKLADFGLSRIANHNNTIPSTWAIGTPGYIDPACMKLEKVKFRPSSDVYSFGVVLLDIACPQKTMDQVREIYRQIGPEKFFEGAADVRLRSDYNRVQMKQVVVLGLWCCFPEATHRPSMEEAIEVLENNTSLLERGMYILEHGKEPIVEYKGDDNASSKTSPSSAAYPN